MNNKVSISYCEDYSRKNVEESLDKCLTALGGLATFIKPKMRVMLKCNLHNKFKPDDALTTNPVIVAVLAEKIAKLGASCVIVDSADSCNLYAIDRIYETTGMLKVSNEGNAELNNNFNVFKLDYDGVMTKQLTLLYAVNECDVIINMPKFIVDNNGMHFAIDNLFGLVPSEMKLILKNRLFNEDKFNNFLVDLYENIKYKLVLNIMDAVVSQEANNSQRIMNCILASENLFALDKVCYQLINCNPNEHSLFKILEKRNHLSLNEQITVLGTNLELLVKQDFCLPQSKKVDFNKSKYYAYQKRPIIKPNLCKGCTRCIKACPTGAIVEKRDKFNEIYAEIDYSKCINCLKCVQSCPYSVIETKVPGKYKTLSTKLEKRMK